MNDQFAIDHMHAQHEQARRSPDHVVDALCDAFAEVETAKGGNRYIRLYMLASSDTAGGWIAVDLHLDDAARVAADLNGALRDALFASEVEDGCIHEIG